MSQHALKLNIQKVDLETNKILSSETISTINIKDPSSIMELGLRHKEQIELLKIIQDKLLIEQSVFLKKNNNNKCPDCGSKIWGNGLKKSEFHSVFTDHRIDVQRQACSSKKCKWSSVPSVKSLLGTSIHPDLYKLQCEFGAKHTYRKAEDALAIFNCSKRDINNHVRIKNVTNNVGENLSNKNKEIVKNEHIPPAKELIVQVDGGHIHNKNKEKRSFEAMCSKIYRPESIVEITETRNKIISKSCAASAKNDKQSSMKKYVLNSAILQGLNEDTNIIGLADGAKNCWSIINFLAPHCNKVTGILDWFHIGKKFENVIKGINSKHTKKLNEIKKMFWHSDVDKGISSLEQIKEEVTIKEEKSKVNGLLKYLNRNQKYIINYSEKAAERKPYTSQVAESTVEHIINDRHKRNQKMQWTRDGAHNVLQIRAAMAGGEWDYLWQETVFEAMKIVA